MFDSAIESFPKNPLRHMIYLVTIQSANSPTPQKARLEAASQDAAVSKLERGGYKVISISPEQTEPLLLVGDGHEASPKTEKFKVFGVDKTTGVDVTMAVEANSKEDAIKKANQKGILVAKVEGVAFAPSPVTASLGASKQSSPQRSPAKLVITRKWEALNLWQDILISYTVMVDGVEVSKVGFDSTVEIPVNPGKYAVCLKAGGKMWPVSSNAVVIVVGDGEVKRLIGGIHGFMLVASFRGLFARDRYMFLQEGGSGANSGLEISQKNRDGFFFCKKCGSKQDESASFCGGCGSKMEKLESSAGVGGLEQSESSATIGGLEQSKPSSCPYCLETIQAGAKKCKHCGEFLASESKPSVNTSSSGLEMPLKKVVLLCAAIGLFPLVGIILSVVNFVKKKPKVAVIFLIASVVWFGLWYGVNSRLQKSRDHQNAIDSMHRALENQRNGRPLNYGAPD